jgi:hypothetical protein
MIEVIKCINTQFPNRPDKICSSIVARTAAWYKEKLNRDDVIFTEKNTTNDAKWLRQNSINKFPALLFYKDGELKYSRAHIMAQAQIMEVIENL